LEKEIQDGADYAVAQLTPKGRFYTDDMRQENHSLRETQNKREKKRKNLREDG
jgi:hypothetical protein